MSNAYLETTIDGTLQSFPVVAEKTVTIGRSADNAISFDDTQVSRHHAMVQVTGPGRYSLIDLGSRNGTILNQRRITGPAPLHQGDRILIGRQEFHFFAPDEVAKQAPSVSPQTETAFCVQQQNITVLVTDIRDFTGWSSRLGEVRLSEVVSTFMREAGSLLFSLGSWGQKYVGDAVMAIFPHSGNEPERSELRGVFRGLDAMFDLAAGLQQRFSLEAPIRIGAGINTGQAALGNMGSEVANDYTALSDAVNLAFRLESATKMLGCDLALGQQTFTLLPAELALFEERTVLLKGYPTPKTVYGTSRAGVKTLVETVFP